ncbi:cryptochrome/photolyase family protein [Haladaptatus sp. GCM10025707]|uniref:cryptochrome/photolyase family protein n=1 Tax=unclassified Haladaptatus TaxID=2622732 RepID=UPI0023E783FA|nr:deoxyribodipyrimidine photo-lyase [Haladaptatus sp. QDMS2]
MHLCWHRRDLRVADNRALAAVNGSVLPVFVFDPNVLQYGSPNRVAFMLDALRALRDDYRDLGGDLLIAQGDPAVVIPELATEHDAEKVVWNTDYSGLARERDAAVRRALADADAPREAFHDAICHEPGSITTNEGDPYSVFTYFGRKWRDREKAAPYNSPESGSVADVAGEELPTLADLGFDDPAADVPPAGTDAARDRLAAFCEGPIFRYADRRDYPADENTSRLSEHLKWGTIGIREVFVATEEAKAQADSEAEAESVTEFQSQLAWREFYTHVLWFNPNVTWANYKTYENPIEWRDGSDELAAWQAGETGYPIVDAGMRQLRTEGFMHNRVRMIVASFLTKDLLIDWRKGYNWFREHLVDHETGNDTGGWQWAASTGTDAQPYFRIFNPMTQGERYDEDATYIKRYVPELRDADPDDIHDWHELSGDRREEAASDYPAPICDHSERREDALAMFEAARGD